MRPTGGFGIKAVYAALLGAGMLDSMIYGQQVAQGTPFPYICLSLSSSLPTIVKAVSPLDEARVQVDVYAATPEEADEIDAMIRDILDFWTGTVEGYVIDGISYIQNNSMEWDDYEKKHRTSADYKVRINR